MSVFVFGFSELHMSVLQDEMNKKKYLFMSEPKTLCRVELAVL